MDTKLEEATELLRLFQSLIDVAIETPGRKETR